MSDDDIWRSLEGMYHELRDVLEMRLETKVEAVGTKEDGKWKDNAPQWYDDDLGSAARSWLLIPYIHSMDREHLQEQQEFGRSLIPSLDHYFEHRVLSLEFVRDWGAFCAAAGALRLAYFSEPDPGRSRQAEASRETNNLDNHRRWFAHYYLRARPMCGSDEAARDVIEKLIVEITNGDRVIGSNTDLKWFDRFLNHDGDRDTNPNYDKLTKEFHEKLTKRKMEELAQQPTEGLPPLDLEITVPARSKRG
jgi:hypothetical protein